MPQLSDEDGPEPELAVPDMPSISDAPRTEEEPEKKIKPTLSLSTLELPDLPEAEELIPDLPQATEPAIRSEI